MSLKRVKSSVWDSSDNIVIALISQLGSIEQEGMVVVQGYSALNDGGGGTFTYDSSIDRSLANGGTIFDATGTGIGTGAWARKYNLSQYSLNWFGVTEDSTANLQAIYGIDDATVTITATTGGGTFIFDSAQVVNNDGVDNFNGWIRTNVDSLAGADLLATLADLYILTGVTPVGGGVYADGITYYTYTQFLVDGSIAYLVHPDIGVPYTTDTDLYPLAMDDPNLTPYKIGNIGLSSLFEVRQVLEDGQLNVTFPAAVLNAASIYIDNNGDKGRISAGIGYNVTGANTIRLVNSYPAGTTIIAINNDSASIPTGYVLERGTAADVQADTLLEINQMVMTAGEFSINDGKGAIYVIIGPGTPGPDDIQIDNGNIAARQLFDSSVMFYDNIASGLTANNVQDALDELAQLFAEIPPPVLITGFTGQISPAGMLDAPDDWYLCDGSEKSRTTDIDLFTAIGTTWGVGDGSTTFNIPSADDIFFRGTDGTTRAIASIQGDSTGPHTHTYHAMGGIDSTHTKADHVEGSGQSEADRIGYEYTTSTGGGSETRPANTAIAYMIKR